MLLSELMGDAFTSAAEKVLAGRTVRLHYYHDNSYDTDLHDSQLIYETTWEMLSHIGVGEETGDPGICDADYFCLFTFNDGSEAAFCFIADEYFTYAGKTYKIADKIKTKTLRQYLSGMADQYGDYVLKNAEIGRGMTELARPECNTPIPVTVPIDLNGDGKEETLDFKLNKGGDEYADGINCTCSGGGKTVSIGYFNPEPGQIRLFRAELLTGGSLIAIVNYGNSAYGNMTVFVYMKDGEIKTKQFADMFPVAFYAEDQAFCMTDDTALSCAEIMAD